MHETVLAKQIIDNARRYETGTKKIAAIVVEVGDLAHVPAEDIVNCIKSIVRWHVFVNRKKAKMLCGCSFSGEPKIIEHSHDVSVYECPRCKKQNPQLIEGDKIILKEIKVD